MATLTIPTEATTDRIAWSPWRLVLTALLLAAGVYATYDAWEDLARIAMGDEEASHIFLVPIVFAWLLWDRRHALRQYRPKSSLLGPVIIALGWLSSWYGYHFATQVLWHAGGVVVAIGCAITLLGHGLIRLALPAFVVLGFLLPVPAMIRQQIAIPLQQYTALATEFCFEVMGLDLIRTGSVLTYNGNDVNVAEACNGMRMVFALLLVAFTYAFTTPLRPSIRLMVFAISPLIAVLCNVIRLVPTVFAYGYLTADQASQFHDMAGWVMLGVAFLMLMGIVAVLRWAQIPVMQSEIKPREQTNS